jgi:hypothetical protein
LIFINNYLYFEKHAEKSEWYTLQYFGRVSGEIFFHFDRKSVCVCVPIEVIDDLAANTYVQVALCSLDDKDWVYTVPPNKDKYGKWKIGFTGEFLEKVRTT